MVLSDLTLKELELAKFKVREKVKVIPLNQISNIFVSDEVINLAEKYIEEGALTIKSYNDALHISLATLNNADVLASWNFKHIVNLDRIKLYNSINLRLGYKIIEIRTPREILNLKMMETIKKFDSVKLMIEIREKLSEKYWKHPDILKKEMEAIREKYNLKLTESNVPKKMR